MKRVVLFNVGWMKYYCGQKPSDRIINGGKYVDEHEDGGEVRNFRPLGGHCYAYARSPRGGRVDIERLGAAREAACVDGVTVIFVATRPEGGSVVTGWYDRARVWRTAQIYKGRFYVAEAPERRCVLLPVDQRVLHVPRARAGQWGIGQSNIRYADEPKARRFLNRLSRFMRSPRGFDDFDKHVHTQNAKKRRGPGRQTDPFVRAKVERAAIRHVIAHFRHNGYKSFKSVERENKGWDLEFNRGCVRLLVEVKGCSGDASAVELTPNEYAAMCNTAYQQAYRLAVVAHALVKSRAHVEVVRFNGSDGTWRNSNDREIGLKTRTGAIVRL
jgi:hypothetical protein